MIKIKEYTDEEIMNAYCSLYFVNYVYGCVSTSDLSLMMAIEKEVYENRSEELKNKIMKEIEILDKIDPENIEWEETK